MLSASDIVGFIAGALVLATFAMNNMRLLRITAILSNMAFIVYGAMSGLLPILALHAILMPLNFLRLVQVDRAELRSTNNRGRTRAIRMATDALILGEALRRRQPSRPTEREADHS